MTSPTGQDDQHAQRYCLNCDTMPDPDARRVHSPADCPWRPAPQQPPIHPQAGDAIRLGRPAPQQPPAQEQTETVDGLRERILSLPFPLGRGCCGAPDATACHQRGLCWMEGVHPDSPGYRHATEPAQEQDETPYDREREEHARDLLRSWADAASNAGCPPPFVARMRLFADMHDRHAAEATQEQGSGNRERAAEVSCSACSHVDFAHADHRGCAYGGCGCERVNYGYGWLAPDSRPGSSAALDDAERRGYERGQADAAAKVRELGQHAVGMWHGNDRVTAVPLADLRSLAASLSGQPDDGGRE